MRQEPQFSIVTVTRNDKAGLKRTLESIAAQLYTNFESLVIDGGSTDGTVALLNEVAATIPQMRFVSEADSGIFDAMNKGFKQSSGDVVVFLNSGDRFSSNRVLQYVANEWQKKDSWLWGYGAIRLVDDLYQPFSAYVHAPFSRPMFELGRQFIPHPSSFFSRDFFLQIGMYDDEYGFASDQELYFRALKVAEPVVWVEFFADFLVGGVSSNVGIFRKERVWHCMRKKHGVLLVNLQIDYLFTLVVATKQFLLSKLNSLLLRQ